MNNPACPSNHSSFSPTILQVDMKNVKVNCSNQIGVTIEGRNYSGYCGVVYHAGFFSVNVSDLIYAQGSVKHNDLIDPSGIIGFAAYKIDFKRV